MTDSKKTKLGLLLIAAPVPLLVGTLAAYAIVAFVVAQSLEATTAPVIGGAVAFALGLCGIIGLLGIFIGMPIGIFLLASRTPKELISNPASQNPEMIEYRSAAAFAKTTVGLLVAFIVASAIDVFAQGAILGYLSTFSFVDILPNFNLAYGFAYAQNIAFIAFGITAVFFLLWNYRSYKNLDALKVKTLEYSPAWAIGGYFVPFVNLFVPFKVMTEMIRESKAENIARFLSIWWITFLIGVGILQLMPTDTKTVIVPIAAWSAIGSTLWDISMIISAVCLIAIVSAVTKNQDRFATR